MQEHAFFACLVPFQNTKLTSRGAQVGPVLYRQSGTWSDYTKSKLVSNSLPEREVTRAIRPTGRFNRSNLPNQTCLPLYL